MEMTIGVTIYIFEFLTFVLSLAFSFLNSLHCSDVQYKLVGSLISDPFWIFGNGVQMAIKKMMHHGKTIKNSFPAYCKVVSFWFRDVSHTDCCARILQ